MQIRFTVGIGTMLQVLAIGCFLNHAPGTRADMSYFAAVFLVLGDLAFIDGLFQLSQSKGYPVWLSALGVFGIIGLAAVATLPYRNRRSSASRSAFAYNFREVNH